MANLTITAANSVYMLAIASLYPVPQQLQGYAADAAFATEDVEPTEVVMGIDGHMSAGFVPYVTPQTITIMPDSPSLTMFEQWLSAMKASREIFIANGTIALPAIGKKYTLTRGVLSRIKSIPDVKKSLQPVEYRITWESVSPAAF
jgi:hypothetical protein